VPCSEIIDETAFPFLESGYRLVLGVVSVPPAFMAQIVPTGERPWRWWRKQSLVIRSDVTLVTIVLPRAWRTRVAIAWGNGNYGPFSALRLTGCGSSRHLGYAYAGGFHLRSRSACVPLVFRVGRRSTTVRFGLGRRC
jgi:hypothetical protein